MENVQCSMFRRSITLLWLTGGPFFIWGGGGGGGIAGLVVSPSFLRIGVNNLFLISFLIISPIDTSISSLFDISAAKLVAFIFPKSVSRIMRDSSADWFSEKL